MSPPRAGRTVRRCAALLLGAALALASCTGGGTHRGSANDAAGPSPAAAGPAAGSPAHVPTGSGPGALAGPGADARGAPRPTGPRSGAATTSPPAPTGPGGSRSATSPTADAPDAGKSAADGSQTSPRTSSSEDTAGEKAPETASLGPTVRLYGTVKGGANIRSGPSTTFAVVGHLGYRSQIPGRKVAGTDWYRIGDGRYIAASVVGTTRPAPPAPRTTTRRPPPDRVITADILAGVNAHRRAAGVGPLQASSCANASAMLHAKAQARAHRMYHRTLAQIENACKMPGGENVAFGYRTPAAVLAGWWASPGHRRNILDPRYEYMGAAVAYASDGTPYYTQVFYIPPG